MSENLETRISSTQAKDTIFKMHNVQSSASEIDAIANTINPLLAPIHKLFRESVNSINTNVKYCVVGDSTRNNTFNEMIAYYTSQMEKINVEVYNNAASGQSGYDWAYNVDSTTLNQLLTFIGNNEENCIIEFSHGINDYKNGATQEQVKTWLRYGLTQLITAKPKVKIILCTPINTAGTDRNSVLKTIYQELASELNLPLIDCTIPTAVGTIQGNSNYYQDGTHPNKFGSRRVVNYILNKLLPINLLPIVTLEQYVINNIPSSLNTTVQTGYWNSTGVYTPSTSWISLALINIEPNFILEVAHLGNRADVCFYNESGVFISRLFDLVNNPKIYTIPANAWKAGINITSDATTWLALNDNPTVKYQDTSSSLYLTTDEINNGLKIRNTINNFRNGILVDDYGKTGEIGQSLKIDSNGKMKWSS